jgi:hypothetical protein
MYERKKMDLHNFEPVLKYCDHYQISESDDIAVISS